MSWKRAFYGGHYVGQQNNPLEIQQTKLALLMSEYLAHLPPIPYTCKEKLNGV